MKSNLKNSIIDVQYDKQSIKTLFDEARSVIFNPSKIREVWDFELRQLLIGVCYGGKIYYKKNEWCYTPEIPSLYLYFQSLNDVKNLNGGGAESWTPV